MQSALDEAARHGPVDAVFFSFHGESTSFTAAQRGSTKYKIRTHHFWDENLSIHGDNARSYLLSCSVGDCSALPCIGGAWQQATGTVTYASENTYFGHPVRTEDTICMAGDGITSGIGPRAELFTVEDDSVLLFETDQIYIFDKKTDTIYETRSNILPHRLRPFTEAYPQKRLRLYSKLSREGFSLGFPSFSADSVSQEPDIRYHGEQDIAKLTNIKEFSPDKREDTHADSVDFGYSQQ